jgi:hypothetical protein
MVKAWPAHLTFSSSNRKSGSQATCTSSTINAVAHGIPLLPPGDVRVQASALTMAGLRWDEYVSSRWVGRMVGGVERTDDADPVKEGDRV